MACVKVLRQERFKCHSAKNHPHGHVPHSPPFHLGYRDYLLEENGCFSCFQYVTGNFSHFPPPEVV